MNTPSTRFCYDPLLTALQETDHPMLGDPKSIRLYGDARDMANNIIDGKRETNTLDPADFQTFCDIVDEVCMSLAVLGLGLPSYFLDSYLQVKGGKRPTVGVVEMFATYVGPSAIQPKKPDYQKN